MEYTRRDIIKTLGVSIGLAALAEALVGSYTPAYAQSTNLERKSSPEIPSAAVPERRLVPIDSATIWTPEKFIREIAEAPRVTYVHWRREGVGDNISGDKMVQDLSKEDNPFLDEIVIIELSRYSREELKKLIKIPGDYNLGAGGIDRVPNGSLFKKKREFRIRGPPRRGEHYNEDYLFAKQAMLAWLSRV